jgi:tripartite-type tricarboxylate transporter receptor subunit TctC
MALPVSSLREFVELAKKQPKELAYGTSGTGTSTHLAMAWLEHRTGISLNHVSYKGLAPVIQDMLGGQLQAAFDRKAIRNPMLSGAAGVQRKGSASTTSMRSNTCRPGFRS